VAANLPDIIDIMTKDFAKSTLKERDSKNRNSRTTSKPVSGESASSSIKPFMTGLFFGVFLCLSTQWLISQNQSQEPVESVVGSIDSDSITKPVLDFYGTLKNTKVMVPEESTVIEQESVEYILQAGSFRDPKDADSLRAQLILLNFATEISKFNHNGDIYHRVIVGPFPGQSSLSKARTTLLENGIESLLFTQPIKSLKSE